LEQEQFSRRKPGSQNRVDSLHAGRRARRHVAKVALVSLEPASAE
jgi:hypothetical protein